MVVRRSSAPLAAWSAAPASAWTAIEGVRVPVCCSPPPTAARRATAPGRRKLRPAFARRCGSDHGLRPLPRPRAAPGGGQRARRRQRRPLSGPRRPANPGRYSRTPPRILNLPVNVKAMVTAHRYVTVRTVRAAPRPGQRCRRQSLRRADGSVCGRWWCAVPPHPWPCGPPHRRPLGPAIEGVRAPVCCSPPSTTAACHRATAPGRRRLRRLRAVVRRRSRPGLCHDRQAHRVAAVAAAQRRPVACQPRPSPPGHPREF